MIPRPNVCVKSKRQIYSNLIKTSNTHFISAYQRYMPKECNFSYDIVRIVEAYRNAANYVVIFLNKADPTDEQFNEVVKRYDFELIKLNEAIRKMTVTRKLTNGCYNTLMMIQRAVTTTGEGLVAGTIITYNSKCRNRGDFATTHRPIQFVSNYLN